MKITEVSTHELRNDYYGARLIVDSFEKLILSCEDEADKESLQKQLDKNKKIIEITGAELRRRGEEL